MSYQHDDERQPIVRYGTPRSFVPAKPEPAWQPPTVIDAPAWVVQTRPAPVDGALAALEGARENTSAMDRAEALQVRLRPFLLAWAGVGLVVGGTVWLLAGTLPIGALLAALTFAGLTAYTYYRLNRTDYEYSREGTERYKVSTAADLARQQMEQEHELRRMALAAYLEALQRHEGKR
jgi:hypothetical protein